MTTNDLEGLARLVVVTRRMVGPENRRHIGQRLRETVDSWRAGTPVQPVTWLPPGLPQPRATSMWQYSWASACLLDDDLASQFEASLPEGMVSRLLREAPFSC